MRRIKNFMPMLNYSVISRIAFLVLFMIVFATAISLVYSFYINKSLEETQIASKEMMLNDIKKTLKNSIQAISGALGEILQTSKNKKETIRKIIKKSMYDENGYFFVYDIHGFNIVHPFFPEFQDRQRMETEDDNGKKYIKELTNKALDGGGFVQYVFYKPGEPIKRNKLVYAQLIPGTEYWIGTGLYIDDIDRDQQKFAEIFTKIHRKAIITVGASVGAVLLFVVIPVSIFMINSILKPWRQLERELMQAQKMEAVGIFASGIAHDFGNVLGAISSCADLALMDAPADSPIREDLEHISKAAKRGKNLVRKIKDFSSTTETHRQTIDMVQITNDCLDLVQTIIPASIEVRRHIHIERIWVMADPDHLLQIIMNLCTNAEQAMRGNSAGILTIDLTAVELSPEEAQTMGLVSGVYARLSVTDNGVGMKPVVLKRIFDPFYTTRKKSGGTGLGLSMTKSIIQMYGGAITVISAPGKGSTFHVLLPSVSHCEVRLPADRHLPLPEGTERILLVDDDKDLAAALHKLFSRLGYMVTSCTDSQDALRIFTASPNKFDLIITDQLMPKLTGTELIKKIKKIRQDIPVVLCSGFEGEGLLSRIPKDLDKAGIAAFFRKPFDTVDICQSIRKVLNATYPPIDTAKDHAQDSHHR
jgi:signal transduction histidine kinase/FixJ family two-component response regulator